MLVFGFGATASILITFMRRRGSLQLQSRGKKRSLAFNRLGSKGKAFSIKSNEIEAIEIHDLVPRRHEIFYEDLFRVVACIDFGYGS